MHADPADIVSQPDLTKRALDYNIWRVTGVPRRHNYRAHPRNEHPCSRDS